MSNTDKLFCLETQRRVDTIKKITDKYTIFNQVLDRTINVANGVGVAELSRLNTAMIHWAPEIRERHFWHGTGSVWGYLDILNNYFKDNNEVYTIYNDFMNTYYK